MSHISCVSREAQTYSYLHFSIRKYFPFILFFVFFFCFKVNSLIFLLRMCGFMCETGEEVLAFGKHNLMNSTRTRVSFPFDNAAIKWKNIKAINGTLKLIRDATCKSLICQNDELIWMPKHSRRKKAFLCNSVGVWYFYWTPRKIKGKTENTLSWAVHCNASRDSDWWFYPPNEHKLSVFSVWNEDENHLKLFENSISWKSYLCTWTCLLRSSPHHPQPHLM